jgi:predicted DCC family thiol-disulfide oxidoreductase YuxK
MRAIKTLCIVYDAECGLCTGIREWLLSQELLVRLKFIASGSEKARKWMPGLAPGELAVVADTGDVWIGNSAWIVCMWALRDYRDWALRFSNPLLLSLAREAFAAVSRNRGAISELLHLQSDADIERRLHSVIVPACATQQN